MRRRNRERNERGRQLFLQNLKGVVRLFFAPQDITWTEELVEESTRRLEETYATLSLMEHQIAPADINVGQSLQLLLDYIRSLHSYAKSFESNFINSACDSFAAQYVTRTEGKGPGRPSLNVTEDQIEFLRSMHFSWEKIAQLLQVSVSTLQRRRRELGIDDHLEQYSDISDEELDRIHKELTSSDKENNANGGFLTPNIGRRRFIGALRSRGIRVQRWRVSQ